MLRGLRARYQDDYGQGPADRFGDIFNIRTAPQDGRFISEKAAPTISERPLSGGAGLCPAGAQEVVGRA